MYPIRADVYMAAYNSWLSEDLTEITTLQRTSNSVESRRCKLFAQNLIFIRKLRCCPEKWGGSEGPHLAKRSSTPSKPSGRTAMHLTDLGDRSIHWLRIHLWYFVLERLSRSSLENGRVVGGLRCRISETIRISRVGRGVCGQRCRVAILWLGSTCCVHQRGWSTWQLRKREKRKTHITDIFWPITHKKGEVRRFGLWNNLPFLSICRFLWGLEYSPRIQVKSDICDRYFSSAFKKWRCRWEVSGLSSV